MSGRSVPEVARNLAEADEEEVDIGTVARAVEEIASYLFPWGFSAYLQLASHLLNIDLPTEVAALPGLVRYGVPQAVAAWLMGFGLVDRRTAISVARVYALSRDSDSGTELPRLQYESGWALKTRLCLILLLMAPGESEGARRSN